MTHFIRQPSTTPSGRLSRPFPPFPWTSSSTARYLRFLRTHLAFLYFDPNGKEKVMGFLSKYCEIVSSYPRLFALFISVVTLGLSALSFMTMESGYVNTEDPTLGFISKGTTIIGREYAKDKVDRGYFYWPGRKRLFYSSPKKASRGGEQC